MTSAYIDPPRQLLMDTFAKAMRAGHVVVVGENSFRFLKRHQKFDDGDLTIQALETGTFIRLLSKTFSSGIEVSGRPHWIGIGQLDDADDYMPAYLDAISVKDRAVLYLQLCANLALNDVKKEQNGMQIKTFHP